MRPVSFCSLCLLVYGKKIRFFRHLFNKYEPITTIVKQFAYFSNAFYFKLLRKMTTYSLKPDFSVPLREGHCLTHYDSATDQYTLPLDLNSLCVKDTLGHTVTIHASLSTVKCFNMLVLCSYTQLSVFRKHWQLYQSFSDSFIAVTEP